MRMARTPSGYPLASGCAHLSGARAFGAWLSLQSIASGAAEHGRPAHGPFEKGVDHAEHRHDDWRSLTVSQCNSPPPPGAHECWNACDTGGNIDHVASHPEARPEAALARRRHRG